MATVGGTARHLLPVPLRNGRFWLVQLLVIGCVVAHLAIDGDLFGQGGRPQPGTLVLFLVPILYAALNFGIVGAFPTAVTATILTLIDAAEDGASANSALNWILHIGAFFFVAMVAGNGVDRERAARLRADAASENHRVAEKMYRSLFAANVAPIIITTADGTVREANAAAITALGLGGHLARSLAEIVGDDTADALLGGAPTGRVDHVDRSGVQRVLRATRSAAFDRDGTELVQIVFHDVTAENLRHRQTAAYAAHVLRGQEEERRRIAQELHDEPVQQLVQLCRVLDSVGEGMRPGIRREVEAARESVEETIGNLRTIAQGLRPPALDDLGLIACMRRLAADAAERTGMAAQLTVSGDVRRLDGDAELALFRIAQEAINNVERHAHATKVDVLVRFEADNASIAVVDDGVGIPPQSESDHAPLGLLGIKERAELMGGHADVRSAPGQGTRVYASLPVNATAPLL